MLATRIAAVALIDPIVLRCLTVQHDDDGYFRDVEILAVRFSQYVYNLFPDGTNLYGSRGGESAG